MKPDPSSRRCSGTTPATLSPGPRRATTLDAEAGFMFTKLRAVLGTLMLLIAVTLPAVAQVQFLHTTNNGTITITGYTGPGGAVTIPATINGLPVTSIGGYAFIDRTSLTSITIPSGVTSIGNYAFNGCTGLTSITVPDSVTSIGDRAFFVCASLTAINVDVGNSIYASVDGVLFNKGQTTLLECPGGKTGNYTIPNSVTTIGDSAFYSCAILTSIAIPSSVTHIGAEAFSYCNSLTNVTIPNSVTSIQRRAFFVCASLTSFVIPSSVIYIGAEAFSHCNSLTNVTIHSGVTSIRYSAFAYCDRLTSVTIPNSVTSIEEGAFAYCVRLPSVTISSGATSIGSFAFYNCTSLASVTIPGSGVTSIGYSAFLNCTSIGYSAFQNCTSLVTVTIGSGVTSIGVSVFSGCASLTAITVDADNSTYGSVDGVLFNRSQTTLIECPRGKTGSYTVPGSVTTIGSSAFQGCASLTGLTIPSNVTRIRENAFSGCISLKGVYFLGRAPGFGSGIFGGNNTATVYYLPGTINWGPTFGGRPTALWALPYPLILNNGPSFGVRTNRFGFVISWATNLSVVVEACTDLAQPLWSPVGTNTLTAGSSYFSDPQWTNHSARFYRLRSP